MSGMQKGKKRAATRKERTYTADEVFGILARQDRRDDRSHRRADAAANERAERTFATLAGMLPMIHAMVTGRRPPVPATAEAGAIATAFVASLDPQQVRLIADILLPTQLEAIGKIACTLGVTPPTPPPAPAAAPGTEN